jgi:hypothetical protein
LEAALRTELWDAAQALSESRTEADIDSRIALMLTVPVARLQRLGDPVHAQNVIQDDDSEQLAYFGAADNGQE